MVGNLQNKASLGGFNVMVVDDDVISLSIVAGILKMLKYDQVVTVTNAQDALIILQQRINFYQLVITDVHMPEMDGFEFQMKVREEFNLPVVMMSADEKETSIVRGLDGGAAFYIVKPVNYDDLRNLWQYAISSRKVKSARNELLVRKSPLNEDEKQNRRDAKNKAPTQVKEGDEKEKTEVVPKKRKVLWTTALHNRFLEAIRKIGLERAVPKRILENMNMPGLTRENVASHLQKYRIFLKRVTDASISNRSGTGMDIIERSLRSSFAAGQPSWVFRALHHGFPEFLDHQQLGSSLQPAYLENILTANGPSHGNALFPNQQDCNQQQSLGNTTPLYLANGLDVTSHQTQGRSELLSNAMPKFTAFGDPGTNNSYMEMNIAGSGPMGFADAEISNGFGRSFGLGYGAYENTTLALLGNLNSGYFRPDAYSFPELGSTNQFPPRFSHVFQEEYNPMLGNISLPMFAETSLNEINFNQLNSSFYNEQQVEELQNNGYIIHPNPVQQNNPGNLSSFNQRQRDGGVNDYNFGAGMDKFNENFLSWNRSYPNQQQGGREFPDNEPYSGYSDVNQAQNQGVADDIIRSIFGPSAY